MLLKPIVLVGDEGIQLQNTVCLSRKKKCHINIVALTLVVNVLYVCSCECSMCVYRQKKGGTKSQEYVDDGKATIV